MQITNPGCGIAAMWALATKRRLEKAIEVAKARGVKIPMLK